MRRKADLASRLKKPRSSPDSYRTACDWTTPAAKEKSSPLKLKRVPGKGRNPSRRRGALRTDEAGSTADMPENTTGERGNTGERIRKASFRIGQIALLLFCLYMVFLTYGVAVTEYGYGPDGLIEPRIMTVEDRRERRDFEAVLAAYEQCRMLYEKILLLDYRLGLGLEEPMTLAPEYEALLEAGYGLNVSALVIRMEALPVNPRYNQLKELMLSWGRNDVALYLQHMSAAITKNDADSAGKALQDKDAVYYDFSTITQNIVIIGDTVPGMDLTSVREWSPSGFIERQVER